MPTLTINDLTPAQVQQQEEFLISFLKSEFPSLNLSVGSVLRTLLIEPAAIFNTLNQQNFANQQASQSMLLVTANPQLADPGVVDGILSNFRITRNPGTKATGQITIIIADLLATTVEQGTLFTANGLSFTVTTAFVGVTDSAAIVGTQQRLITAQPDGTFAFTVPVTAVAVGSAYRMKQNQRFTAVPPVSGAIDYLASADFIGGSDAQTNDELVNLFKQALSPQVMSSRVAIESILRTVRNIVNLSIIGFGDAEMSRDRHNIFSLSQGGKADVYTRTQDFPTLVTVQNTAVLLDINAQLWQIAIDRDDAPGFYSVLAVRQPSTPTTDGSLPMTGETRSLDLSTSEEFVPAIDNIVEGAYSRYTTAIIQFTDPNVDYSGLSVGSKAPYNVDVLALPGIADLQAKANDRSARNPQADYLVKAPVPAFVTVEVTVQYQDGDPAPDAGAIQTAIATAINVVNFKPGFITAATVHEAVNSVVGGNAISISPLEFFMTIRRPDGTTMTIRSIHGLVIPNDPARGVTNRTTAFFCSTQNVEVTIQKIAALPV